MGLAPYGEPKYKNLIKNYLIDIKKDGSFKLNQKYFNYSTGLTMTNKNFSNLKFGIYCIFCSDHTNKYIY